MTRSGRNVPAPAADLVVVTAICFGWFILLSLHAVAANFPSEPFTDGVFLEIITIEFVLAAAALGYLRVRGYDLRRLLPKPTIADSLVGVGLFVAAWIASSLLSAAVGNPARSAEPIGEMVAQASISFAPLLSVAIVNGLYEETFLVGYLQDALQATGASFALGVSALVRVLYHLYQGPTGALSALVFGVVLGVFYLATRRLWPLVFAHIMADVLGFALG